MVFILVLVVILLVLFWVLPFGFAIAGAVVIALLVAAKLRDAAHHGRLVNAARKKDEIGEAEIRDMVRRDTMFYALWIGLTVAGSGHQDSGSYVHGQHGGDFGGDFGGGHGDGGGDSGGGGGGGL